MPKQIIVGPEDLVIKASVGENKVEIVVQKIQLDLAPAMKKAAITAAVQKIFDDLCQ